MPVLNIWPKLKYQPVILQAIHLEGTSRGPRRFAGPSPFRLSPVQVGQEYDVRIESMSRRGDSGVARIQGLVVFVSRAKTGEQVRIKITKMGSGFATADVAPAPSQDAGAEGGSGE